jgi:myo-inositol-hexaphosphate 3-phosphohydrolase
VFINNGGDGLVRQWRITASNGRAVAEQVREFPVGSQAEGCVADDETGALYVAEEGGGFFRFSAASDGGSERREIDRVDSANGLKADIEGVSLWAGKDGKGYLVLSNQGADNYAVYRREGDNAFVGIFHIVADPERGIDGDRWSTSLARPARTSEGLPWCRTDEPLAARETELRCILERHRQGAGDRIAASARSSRPSRNSFS